MPSQCKETYVKSHGIQKAITFTKEASTAGTSIERAQKRPYSMTAIKHERYTGGATCGQLSIWDRLTRVKVLPLWRAPFIRGDLERVLRRERRDYVEGRAGRATCDLKNDPIRAGHRPSGTPPCPVAFYRGIEVDKKEFNILCGGRSHL